MKWDYFYKGLDPEYQWMVALKVDSEHHTRYSNPAPSSLEIGKMGWSQRFPTPKNHPNWGIEQNSFSDLRELVSLPEVEG